ncbi:MAG TPA: hypothetical protein VLS93_07765 [Anaeromyxobacteraceae bacterium]|nr:hypothetical protein [Anaeromyxobacteraceae bacterium]
MSRNPLLLAFALSLLPAAAGAQARAGIRIDIELPALPQLVVIQPGVQVVAGFPEEVFHAEGAYWLRRDDGWYRAPSPRASFIVVETRLVPRVLVTLAPGRYRNWHEAEAAPPPPPSRPPPPPPPSGDVLRTKELRAGRVRARVIYAKEVKARDGRIGRIYQDRHGKQWKQGRAHGEIEVPEITADVIYAKEVEADWLEAGEIHAQEVKIGR